MTTYEKCLSDWKYFKKGVSYSPSFDVFEIGLSESGKKSVIENTGNFTLNQASQSKLPNKVTVPSDDENTALLEKSERGKTDKDMHYPEEQIILPVSQEAISDNSRELEKNVLNICALGEIKRHQIRKVKDICGKTGRHAKSKTKNQTHTPLFHPNLSSVWLNRVRQDLSREKGDKSNTKLPMQRDGIGMSPEHDPAALPRFKQIKCAMKRCAVSIDNLRSYKIPKLDVFKTPDLFSEGLVVHDSKTDLTQSEAVLDSQKMGESIKDQETQFLQSSPSVSCRVIDKNYCKFDESQESRLNLSKLTIDHCDNISTNSQANVVNIDNPKNPESKLLASTPTLEWNFTEDTFPQCTILKSSSLISSKSIFDTNYLYYDFETDSAGTWIDVSKNANMFSSYLGSQLSLSDEITPFSRSQNHPLKKWETCSFPPLVKGALRNFAYSDTENKNKIETRILNGNSKEIVVGESRHVAEIQKGNLIPYFE